MRKLLGGILLAIGILIAGASGLCSLVFLLASLGQSSSAEGLGLVLVVGGIPLVVGIGLIFAGHALIRASRAEDGFD